MFSKHVWHDRKHMAEVYIAEGGIVSGTLVAYEGAVCLINPRPEILTALYQEAKLKRILSIKAVLLTDNTIQYTRGLCALVGYSRGLGRKTPLQVITRSDCQVSTDFLHSCCARLLEDSAFDVDIMPLPTGKSQDVGSGAVRYVRPPKGVEGNPYLVVKTDERTLHYYDETHKGEFDDSHVVKTARPNVVIRAAELPKVTEEKKLFAEWEGGGEG